MSRYLYIAGVNRWKDLERGSLQIEAALTYQVDTCDFQVRGIQPLDGEEVVIEDDGFGRLFGGIITKVELLERVGGLKLWQVECEDYTFALDREMVVETYENITADAIFLDIVAKYCPDFTVNGVQTGAPIIEYKLFDYVYPSEAFKQLCQYTGWEWQSDYYKDLKFFNPQSLNKAAPISLKRGAMFTNFKHSIERQGLRNRVYVRGGTMLSDPFVYEVKSDGVARIWNLPHKPHEISMKVSEVTKSVGIENVSTEANFDYLMNYQEKYVRASIQTVTPVDGATMQFTYKNDIDVITMVEDISSQQAIAAVQGGNGVYAYSIVDDSLTTIEAAEAAGQADLREHANPRVKGSFVTGDVGAAGLVVDNADSPLFTRSSTAYLLDGSFVAFGSPRYEYIRQSAPAWQDNFDANRLSQYTSGGNVLATWTAITGPIKHARMKGKSEKNYDYGYLYDWDGDSWGQVAQRSSPDLFVEYDEWIAVGAYAPLQIKTVLTTDNTYLESPTYVDVPEVIVGDNDVLVSTGGALYLSTVLNNDNLVSSPWAPPEMLEVTGGSQATLIKNDLSLQDCEIEINSDQSHDGGIIVRYQDNNNYYLLASRDDSGANPDENLRIYKRVGGTFTALGFANMAWPRGTSKQIKFSCKGSRLEAYFEGIKVLSVTDTTFTSGGVGLRNNSPTAFRVFDFTVYYASPGVMVEEGTTNLLSDNQASVETDLTGLAAWDAGTTLSRDTVEHWHGSASLKVVTNGSVAFQGFRTSSIDVTASLTYTASAWLKGAGNLRLAIEERNSSDNAIGNTIANFALPDDGQWHRYTVTKAFGATGVKARLIVITNNLAQALTFYADGMQIEQKSYATSWTLPSYPRVAEVMTIPTAGIFVKSNWTAELTFRPTSKQNVVDNVLWSCYIDANNYYELTTTTAGYLQGKVLSNGTAYTITGAAALAEGTDYSIMFSGNGSVLRLCMNGAQIGSDMTYTEPVGTLPVNMYIGSKYNSSAQLNGIIDNFRIYNRTRTLEEYQSNYNTGLPVGVDAYTKYHTSFNNTLNAEKGYFLLNQWIPGQLVAIDLPDFGVSNTFVVQTVTLSLEKNGFWLYSIQYGGRMFGIADFLKALISAQQQKKLNETALIHKFSYNEEANKMTDEILFTFRTPPWYLGDIDAIIGYVMCSD